MIRLRAFAAALVPVLVLAACDLGAASSAPSAGPDEQVFRVEVGGGLPGLDAFDEPPLVAVYGDGRVFRPGPMPAADPPPLVRPVVGGRVSQQTIAQLFTLAADNALLRSAHYDLPGLFDATTTVLTIRAGGAVYEQSVYALGAGAGMEAGLDRATIAARGNVAAFVSALLTLSVRPDPDVVSSAIRIRVGPATNFPEGGQAANPVPWPLPGDLGRFGQPAPFGRLERCGVVRGGDLATLRPTLDAATVRTEFTSHGTHYRLTARPLLPGERDC